MIGKKQKLIYFRIDTEIYVSKDINTYTWRKKIEKRLDKIIQEEMDLIFKELLDDLS